MAGLRRRLVTLASAPAILLACTHACASRDKELGRVATLEQRHSPNTAIGCRPSDLQLAQLCLKGHTPGRYDRSFPRLAAPDNRPELCRSSDYSYAAGQVRIEASVDKGGRAVRARVIRSWPPCDAACIQWTITRAYLPALADGTPADGIATLVCDQAIAKK